MRRCCSRSRQPARCCGLAKRPARSGRRSAPARQAGCFVLQRTSAGSARRPARVVRSTPCGSPKARKTSPVPRALRKLDHYAVLLLDDVGYIQQSPDEAEILFTLLAERYERRSELRFVCGPASTLLGNGPNTQRVTHAVFFHAPLGMSDSTALPTPNIASPAHPPATTMSSAAHLHASQSLRATK